MSTLLGAALLVLPVVVVITVVWACAEPRSLRYLLSAVGIESPWRVVSTGFILLGVGGLLVSVGTIARPWVLVGLILRPARRWRLWGYQAGLAGRGPCDFLGVLANEHSSRVAFWRERLKRKPPAWTEITFVTIDPLAQQLWLLFGLLGTLLWIPPIFGVEARWYDATGLGLGCVLPACAWAPFLCGLVRRRLVVRRLLRTLEHSRCPDCGYDLFDVPPALPKYKVPGAGSSRCPECGSMWPLVPPPVDIDEG